MAWGKEIEEHRQKKTGKNTVASNSTSSTGASKQKIKNSSNFLGSHVSSIALIGVMVATVGLKILWKRRAEISSIFKGNGGKSSSKGSAFTFPQSKSVEGKRALPTGVPAGDNVPRNKKANNKKNKARKKDKKEMKEAKIAEKESHPPALENKGNQIPKDEDIIGGEIGKTFTTTSHMKVSTGYAKIRETVGNA
mmetsp:Transcript_39647/g.55053  ORF Transcript_39647/g.55053 Transcript_39647/m.55053 type:complete len:194 (+) Transcript_39647:179-760(+)